MENLIVGCSRTWRSVKTATTGGHADRTAGRRSAGHIATAPSCVTRERRPAVPSGAVVEERRRPWASRLGGIGGRRCYLMAGDVVGALSRGWAGSADAGVAERMSDERGFGRARGGLQLGFAGELESGGGEREGRAGLQVVLLPVAQASGILIEHAEVNEWVCVLAPPGEFTDVREVLDRGGRRLPVGLRHGGLPAQHVTAQHEQELRQKCMDEGAKPHVEQRVRLCDASRKRWVGMQINDRGKR